MRAPKCHQRIIIRRPSRQAEPAESAARRPASAVGRPASRREPPEAQAWLAQSRARSALRMLGVLGSCSATPTSFMYRTKRPRICSARHERGAQPWLGMGEIRPKLPSSRGPGRGARDSAAHEGACPCPSPSRLLNLPLGGAHLGQGVVARIGHAALGALVLDDLGDGGVVAEGDGGEQVVLHLQVEAACRGGARAEAAGRD